MKYNEDILFWAFRYALGRMTYCVADVAEAIIVNAPYLQKKTRYQIIREITDAIMRKQAGIDMDVERWREVVAALKTANQSERKQANQ